MCAPPCKSVLHAEQLELRLLTRLKSIVRSLITLTQSLTDLPRACSSDISLLLSADTALWQVDAICSSSLVHCPCRADPESGTQVAQAYLQQHGAR